MLCRVRGFSGGLGLHGAFAGATPRSRGGHTRDVVCSAHAAQSSTVRMDNSIRLRYIGPASQRLFFPRKPYGTATCAYDSRLTFPLSSDGTSNNSKPRPRSGLRQELLPKQEQANLLEKETINSLVWLHGPWKPAERGALRIRMYDFRLEACRVDYDWHVGGRRVSDGFGGEPFATGCGVV